MSQPTLQEIEAFFKTFDYSQGQPFEISKGQLLTDVKKLVNSHIAKLESIANADNRTKRKHVLYWERLLVVYRFYHDGEIPSYE